MKTGDRCIFTKSGAEVELMGVSTGYPGDGWKKWWVVKRLDTGKEMIASEEALEPVKTYGTKVILEAPKEAVQKLLDDWKNKDPKLLELMKEFGVTDVRIHQ